MLQQIVFGVLVIVVVAYALTSLREGFEDGPSPILHAPILEDRIDHADDDSRDIPWIATWSPADRAARKGNSCTVLYRETGPDGTILMSVPASCENGMAHTRPGDRILLPESIPLSAREETIQHELIHVYQRRNPEVWVEFYRRQWSFVFYASPPMDLPRSVRSVRRSNPDTWEPRMGGPWSCWMGRYWPIPVYTNPTSPRLRDAQTIWWDSLRREVLLEAPAPWRQFFGTPPQDEHPHELAAVMITSNDTSSEAGRRLLAWWSSTGRALVRA